MSESYKLMELYENMLRNDVATINEEIEKRNKSIRFVMPAILDFSISQDEIEESYTYRDFVDDMESNTSEKEILSKLAQMVEILAQEKINNLNRISEGFDIKSTKRPELKNAQFYRLALKDVVDYYKDMYDQEQITTLNTSEKDEQPINQ